MDASQSFEYKLTVHQLRPWPLNGVGAGGPQFIAIGWQRGKQTGAVDAVKAKVTAKGYGVYMFNEDLTISANLRKGPLLRTRFIEWVELEHAPAPAPSPPNCGAPGFEKKFLQLAAISVHRGMTEDRPIASLGTVVINLADFTDVKRGPKKLAFRVSVGREVTNALSSIGKPEAPSLIVTMQAVKKTGGRALDRDASSFSSRGSRITGDLSAFFGKDKHSAREPVPEEEEPESVPTGVRPPGTLESFGAASGGGSTPGLPPSDMRATPAQPARAVDSDGFEVDSSEDAVVAAAAQRPAMHTRKPSFLNNTSGGAAQRDEHKPTTTPPLVSSHQKKSFSMLEEMNARKNRVAAMRGEPGSTEAPTAKQAAEPAVTGAHQQSAGEPAEPAEMASEWATPTSQPTPAATPAPAKTPDPAEAADDAAPRRKTGKTTFIRDWLGSAEPAPGEGPSIRFTQANESPDAKPQGVGLPSTQEEEGSGMAGTGVQEDEAAEDPARRHLAQSLSMSRNHDLRMVLDSDRIHQEGDSIMKDIDEAAAAAAQMAEELEDAPVIPVNGRQSSGSRAGVQDTPDSAGVDDADEAVGRRKFAWQRKRGSIPEVAAVPEDRTADEVRPGEVGGTMGQTLGVEDLLQNNDLIATGAVTQDMRRIDADAEHAERLATHERQYAETERRLQEADSRAAEAERRASAAQQRADEIEQQADALQQQIEQDAKAGHAAEKKAKARLDALQVQIDQQEAAVAAARSRAAEAEAEASKQAARREEEAADVVLESVAASSSFVLETGPLDGASARGAGAQPRKAGKELKWRRASQGSAALNTAHSTVMDDADQKLMERLEHELCVVGILETAVHCCSCFHQDEGGTSRSQSHVTHTPARRIFRALISLPQEEAEAMVPVVLRAIRCRTQKQWADDVPLAFFWWSNIQMLRVFLQQLDNGSVVTVGDCAWLKPMLDPGLQEIGEEIFNGIVSMLWSDVMLPMQERSAARKSSSDNTEEEAMMRWMTSLEVANDRLSRALLHVEGFSAVLLPLVQVALLARIDFLFYSNIMAVGGEEHPQSAFGRGGGWAVPPHMLPFSIEGRVSFQTGMQLKMAVMHMSHWAHDHDLRDKDGVMLYPFMRGTADVLMMKKDLLLDDETRLSVASALPVPAVLHLLSHFAPDEFSPDEVDPAVLQELREVAAGVPQEMGSLQPYAAPAVVELAEFADREIAEGVRRRGGRAQSMAQVSVQIGDDSDAELHTLADETGDPNRRFKLVQELWGKAHDRRDE